MSFSKISLDARLAVFLDARTVAVRATFVGAGDFNRIDYIFVVIVPLFP